METRKRTIINLLIPSILCLAILFVYKFLVIIAPTFAQMSLRLRIGISGMTFGVPYYLLAMILFFAGIGAHNPDAPGIKIAGRPFNADLKLTNPVNHIIFSTLVLFSSLGIIFL
jgi:hypothetical protein